MRKHQYQKISELLKAIGAAQENGLFDDSKAGALALIGFINKIEGRETETVRLLESYCDILTKVQGGELGKKNLQKQFAKVQNTANSELKPRIEMAFISYKASMSDSLESIYLAAKADPDCDAYWIPVPYYEFDRSTDTPAAHLRYEGAEFYGSQFEITDWQTYSIEARRPDVIFTFNPYDDNNRVTSIHPDFYCKRLRELTELLVYVPYFVGLDDVSEDFCVTPGSIFAHKVIVQSEKIRDTYIRVIKEQFGNQLGSLENKFVALGSPKFDKCLNARSNDYELPDSWRELIGDKKVVFYNSSIGSILQGDLQYLKKIRHVLDTFRNSDNIVLWWRPHPLSSVTYQSMRPQLLDEYIQIIEEYKSEGWGIFDDTPDLHRAIACTDAYYGDWSSVVLLYSVTGKPVMIGDVNVLSGDMVFRPARLFFIENEMYFILWHVNMLVKLNETDNVLELAGSFPNEAGFTDFVTLYVTPVENNGTLYFPPYSANEIAVYLHKERVFEKIPYANNSHSMRVAHAFVEAVVYENYIFFVPLSYPAIMTLNSVTKGITFYDDWVSSVTNLVDNEDNMPYVLGFHVVGNVVWLLFAHVNAVLSFDMETYTSTVHEVGQKQYRYHQICFDGMFFWISPYPNTNTPIVKWSPDTGVSKEFSDFYTNDESRYSWYKISCSNGYVWFVTLINRYSFKINMNTEIISPVLELNTNYSEQMLSVLSDTKFNFIQQIDDSIFAYHPESATLIEYNRATQERKDRTIRYSREVEAQLASLLASRFSQEIINPESLFYCLHYESPTVRLLDFMYYISNLHTEETERKRKSTITHLINTLEDGSTGTIIYNYIKN